MIRLVIADDHAIVRRGLHALLEQAGGYAILADSNFRPVSPVHAKISDTQGTRSIVFARAEDLAIAMESRNYRGGEGRTRMNPLRWTGTDTAALAGAFLFVFLLIFADRQFLS